MWIYILTKHITKQNAHVVLPQLITRTLLFVRWSNILSQKEGTKNQRSEMSPVTNDGGGVWSPVQCPVSNPTNLHTTLQKIPITVWSCENGISLHNMFPPWFLLLLWWRWKWGGSLYRWWSGRCHFFLTNLIRRKWLWRLAKWDGLACNLS